MKKITYSAPAKIILSGEHASIYGKPTLISSVNLKTTFTIWEGKLHEDQEWINALKKAVQDFLFKKKVKFVAKDFDFFINSEIPQGMHMGSSAALSVSSAAALLDFYSGKEWDKESINIVAYEIEKFFHGKPSGGDNSTSCFGGLIYFRKEFEFLKQISALNFKIPQNIEKRLFLIYSGEPVENTLQMIERVGKIYNANPEQVENLFNKQEKITKKMVLSIVKEDSKLFKKCLEENEQVLEKIEVSSLSTQSLLNALSIYGVGKVTGGGGFSKGSGMIIFFVDNPNEFEEYANKSNIKYIKFNQDNKGVQKYE